MIMYVIFLGIGVSIALKAENSLLKIGGVFIAIVSFLLIMNTFLGLTKLING
jgi:hypothetical protein